MGSLTVVGTGIELGSQLTPSARSAIERADKVLYLVADPAACAWITEINATAESLSVHYGFGKNRHLTYHEIVERILAEVRAGKSVCVVSYGHPGVFAIPTHESVRRARMEGFEARMQPAISAEDCLFADLGVDPGRTGCQSFDSTDFLVYRRKFDPNCSLVLWQVGVTGELGFKPAFGREGLGILIEELVKVYGVEHTVVIYEAAQYPFTDPVMLAVPLGQAPTARVTPLSTMYVPPLGRSKPDIAMLDRLKIPREIFAEPD